MNHRVLWEMEADELEQHLLRHGRSERAPDASRRLAVAVAVAAAGSGLASTSSAAGAVAVGVRSAWWLVGKWLAIGAASGAVVMGAAASWPRWQAGPAAPVATGKHVQLAPPRASASFDERALNGLGAEADPGPRPAASSAAASRAPFSQRLSTGASRGEARPTAPPDVDRSSKSGDDSPLSLREELGLLQQGRHALDAGDAPRAFDALTRYDQRFPAGRLRVEATALRIEAQFAASESSSARASARAFLASNPQSPAALRVRHLLDVSERPTHKP